MTAISVLILLACSALGYFAWRRLPVGKAGQYTVRLHEWWSWRATIRTEGVKKKLKRIESLPVESQLFLLASLFEKHCSDRELAGKIAGMIFATGREESLSLMESALSLDYVSVHHVVHGIFEALKQRTASAAFREGAFAHLARKLKEISAPDSLHGHIAPELVRVLITLSPTRGADTARACLNIRSSAFACIFDSLTNAGHTVPLVDLRRWLGELNLATLGERDGKKAVQILRSLGLNYPAEADPLLEQIMNSQSEEAELAAEALLELRGLPHPVGGLIDKRDKLGHENLNTEERIVCLAQAFSYYVSHQFSESLLEEEGHNLREMADALRRIKAPRSAQLIDKIISLLPSGDLPADADQRESILRTHPSNWRDQISELIANHEYDGEYPFLLALKYELAHSDSFRSKSS